MDYPLTLVTDLRPHLRSLRKARGWTQAMLAQRLGVVQSRVADIEANPGAVSVEQLMQVLSMLDAGLVVRVDPTSPIDADDGSSLDRSAAPDGPPRGEW